MKTTRRHILRLMAVEVACTLAATAHAADDNKEKGAEGDSLNGA
jgi:hypothetical protein